MCGEEVHERTRIHHEHKHPEAIYPNLLPVRRRKKIFQSPNTTTIRANNCVFTVATLKNNYRSIWECLITTKHAFFNNTVKR